MSDTSVKYTFQAPMRLTMASSFDTEAYGVNGTPERASEINDAILRDSFFSEDQAMYVTTEGPAILESVLYGAYYDHASAALYAVAYVRADRKLTEAEEKELIRNISGQFSDGWGESFEQTPVHGEPPYDCYYAHFWDSEGDWELVKV